MYFYSFLMNLGIVKFLPCFCDVENCNKLRLISPPKVWMECKVQMNENIFVTFEYLAYFVTTGSNTLKVSTKIQTSEMFRQIFKSRQQLDWDFDVPRWYSKYIISSNMHAMLFRLFTLIYLWMLFFFWSKLEHKYKKSDCLVNIEKKVALGDWSIKSHENVSHWLNKVPWFVKQYWM